MGADINRENMGSETPLFYACSSGNEAIVKYLVELGADIDKDDVGSETPLFSACSSGNEALVRLFNRTWSRCQ